MSKNKSIKTNKKSIEKYYSNQGWYFVIVSIILLCIFVFFPILKSLIMTTQKIQGVRTEFVGFQNFKRVFKDEMFWISISNTFTYLIIQVPIMLMLAMFFSTLLNNPKLRFRNIYRTCIFLPVVTSLVAYSVLFKMLFATTGIINQFFVSIHLIKAPIDFLSNPTWAKAIIIIALLWRWTGYNMIFFLSGLQTIPTETYEAADLDGSNSLDKFFKITVPQLKPIILFTSIMSTIGTLQLFDEPMNLTKGGPGNATITISQYIYNHAFVYPSNFGYVSTLSYIIVIIVILFSFIQFKSNLGKE